MQNQFGFVPERSTLKNELRLAWRNIRDRFSPFIIGPKELDADAFIAKIREVRPKTMMMQWGTFNNWGRGKLFTFSFRAGRTMYVTHFYVNAPETGYLQELWPEAFNHLAGSNSAIYPVRNPADRLIDR